MRGAQVLLLCKRCGRISVHRVLGHLVKNALRQEIKEEFKHKVLCHCTSCHGTHTFPLIEVITSLQYKRMYFQKGPQEQDESSSNLPES